MDFAHSPVTHDESAAATPPALAIEGLSHAFGEEDVLANVSAAFPARAMAAIIGPNGAGKSTLIKAALGLVKPREGRARFFGRPFAEMRDRIAYVPQRASVEWDFPVRVLDVVLMGLVHETGFLPFTRARHRDKAEAALARVGLADYSRRQIGQLSGGQQQRVFLARAFAQAPDLMLLDEPLAGIDAATEEAIVRALKAYVEEGGSVIAVHHDLSTVRRYFGHALLLNRRVIAAGPVREVFNPRALSELYGVPLDWGAGE